MTYAKPFVFDIDPDLPLLIMACSATKRDVAGDVRFIELYDGPMWRQIRASGFPASNVAAISALYGFLEPGYQIETYDIQMDEKRSARICGLGNHVWRLIQAVRAARGAMVFGGQLYRNVASTAQRVEPELNLSQASGTFLEQRKQLGAWLRANSPQADCSDDEPPAAPRFGL